MRRVAMVVAGVAGVVAVLSVWKCATSRPASTDESSPSKSSSSSSNRGTRVDPKTLPKASISGKVIAEGGHPIAHARVCTRGDFDEWDLQPICTVASEAGAYTISVVPATYVVSAIADTFRPAIHHVAGKSELVLAPGERKAGVDVTLSPGGVELNGTVVDVSGGPIGKARVTVEASSWSRDRAVVATDADADGRFRVWVAPGTMLVRASAQRYADRSLKVEAPATIELALTPASSLSGTVVDAATNEPVAGARVLAVAIDYDDRGSALSDDSGRFRIDELTPGRYEIKAHTEQGFGASAGSVLVGLGQDVDGIVLKLWPAFRIEGRVLISTTKTDCARGWVTLQDTDRDRYEHTRRRPDGVVAGDGLLPGTYKVNVGCPDYVTRKTYPDITIVDRDAAGLVWEVDPGATIRGRVLTKSGAPVGPRAVIARIESRDSWEFMSGMRNATPDSTGQYVLAGLVPGKYRVEVLKEKYADMLGGGGGEGFNLELTAGASVERDITIEDVGIILGTAVGVDGRPLRALRVSAFAERSSDSVTTDASGRFRMEVPAGVYSVVADRDIEGVAGLVEIKKRSQSVEVVSNKMVEVRLLVKTGAGAITGVVLDVDGKPVHDAYVYAAEIGATGGARRSWEANEPPAMTSADGAFTLDGLASGQYSVHAFRKGGGQASADKVAVGTSTTLRLKRTSSIEGVVTRKGGPIADLSIELNYPKTWLSRREQFLRSDGRFVMRDLPEGHLQLTAFADGRRGSVELDLVEGETKTVTLEVAEHVTLTGRVLELGTSKPVVGLEVLAKLAEAGGDFTDNTTPRGVTDSLGRFSIPNVPVGKLAITGWLDGSGTGGFFTKRTIVAGGTVDVGDFSLVRSRLTEKEWPGDLGFELVNSLSWLMSSGQKLKIQSIDPSGPAAKSGLEVGDVIISVDGYDVRGDNVYMASMLRAPAGTKLTIGVARGASASITVGPRKE